MVETAINAGLSNGGLVYDTKAHMDGDLAHAYPASAWVIGDQTVANNGIYQKQGASGSGSWTRVGDLPYSFIKAVNAGAGTANAIQATTPVPIPAGDGAALIILNITENNAGASTVSFNGGSALTIKTASGADVYADYLVDGSIVTGFIVGGTFRLTSDVATAADRAAAEAAADRAEDAAAGVNLPSIGAGDAGKVLTVRTDETGYELEALPSSVITVADRTELKAVDAADYTTVVNREAGFPTPFVWRSGDYSSEVANDPYGAYYNKADAAEATVGAWVAQDAPKLTVDPERFGAVSNPAVDNTLGYQRMAAYANQMSASVVLPPWKQLLREQIAFDGAVSVEGAGRGKTKLCWDDSATGVGLKFTYSGREDRVSVRGVNGGAKPGHWAA